MSGYRSTERTLAAAMAGGLGLGVAGAALAWTWFLGQCSGIACFGVMWVVPPVAVVCGISGAVAAARSPRRLGAVLGAGLGVLLAKQLVVQPGYLGRPFESVLGSSNDPVAMLVGGAIGALVGWWLAASAKSKASALGLIGVAVVACVALYLADDPTRLQLLVVRLPIMMGRAGDANLSGANLSYRSLAHANLAGVDLSHAAMWGTDLSGANLSRANLTGAQLGGARLAGANLSGADLSLAHLESADLRGADLDGAHISQGQLDATVSYRGALNLPDGLRPDTRPVREGYPPPYP